MITTDNFELTHIENQNSGYEYHFHIHFEIISIQSGSAVIFSDGYEVDVNRGECLIIPPFCPHKLIYTDCSITKITFPLSYIDKYLTADTLKTLNIYYSTKISIGTRLLSDTIVSLADDISCGDTSGAFIYIYKLLRNCIPLPETQLKNDTLVDVMTYIGIYSYDKIMLDDAAKSCNVTKYHICRLFKTRLGITPVEYITFARIRRAIAKLLYTNNTISKISRELGFYSPNYFTTLFKSYFGILPSEMRKNVNQPSHKRYYLRPEKH